MKNNFWNCVPVSTVAEIVLGGTPSRNNPDYWDGEIKWASAADIASDQAKYIFSTKEKITEVGLKNSPAKLLGKDTVVITARGTVGAIRMLGTEMSFNQTCYGLVAKETIDPSFLYYALMFKINVLKSLSYGTVFDTITKNTFDSLAIPLPPLPEQRAIAAILGALDDKIELNHRMNRTLEEMAWIVYKDFVKYEKGIETTIGDVLSIVGGSTPSTANPEFWEDGDICWATPKDLAPLKSPILLDTKSKITKLGLQQISSGLLPVGTVLLSSRAPIGYLTIAQVPIAINQGFIAIKCTDETPNYFILNWLKDNMDEIIGRANGTTFMEISKSNFRSMPIFVPPYLKMRDFVKKVEPIYQKIIINMRESNILRNLRDVLLPKLIKGEIEL